MAFQKGESGNPQGKPKGTRHRVTIAAEILLEGEAEAITRKAIELAKAGDGPALRLCMDRIYPARKDRPVRFRLPPLEKVGDAVVANAAWSARSQVETSHLPKRANSRSSSMPTRGRSRQQISRTGSRNWKRHR